MKAKIKRFFESIGFTKSQLITVFLCYFLCFALFLGVVVIWDPMSKSTSEQTIAVDDTTPTGPTNTDGWWITEGRYSIEWFKNAQSVEIDGTTYQPGTEQNPYKIDSAEDLAGLSWLVYTKGQEGNPLVPGTDYSENYIFQRKYFKQTANIDLSAYYWQPIGIKYTREETSRSNYFSGNYDGGNHTVSGIFTPAGSSNAYSYQGLFGYVYSQSSSYSITIKNIDITNSFIQGYQKVGGVVGETSDATITNCYNTGDVSGSRFVGGVVGYASGNTITITNCYNRGTVTSTATGNSNVGGVVGYASNTTITDCYNTGSVNGFDYYVGGVVGRALGTTTTITNCYNTGAVSGSSYVGGVVGRALGTTTTITNCYNTGDVTGSSRVGGVVGSSSGTITNCYNTGSVSGSSSVGGVVGSADSSATITNCYYGENCLETVGGINGADETGQAEFDPNIATNAKTLSWYSSESWDSTRPWDFEDVWQINASLNDGYPAFLYQEIPPIDWWTNEGNYSIEWYNNPDTDTYGDGSESNPYIIDSAEDLAGLSWLVYTCGQEGNPLVANTDYWPSGDYNYIFEGKYFIQESSIDLSEHVWQPIGIYYDRSGSELRNYFSGNYDGQNNTVSGVNTPAGNTNAYSYQGLFGCCDLYDLSGTYEIKNVNIVNSNINGYDYVGGVVGSYINVGLDLINCSNFGSVAGNKYVGGIIGYSYRFILNCYNGGEIFGNSYVGGISGRGNDIIKCHNLGKINGSTSVGGIVGAGYASYCYNRGEIFGVSCVGGLVGGDTSSTEASLALYSYNTGYIVGENYVGGIVGFSFRSTYTDESQRGYYANGTISYNINVGQVQGVTNVGQIAGFGDYTQLLHNYFSTGSANDSVDGATFKSNLSDLMKDANWLRENVFWDMGFVYKTNAEGYPTFRAEDEKNSWLNADLVNINTDWKGTGDISDPYKISTAEDLAGLALAVNTGMKGNQVLEYDESTTTYMSFMLGIPTKVYFSGVYFKQTADIDLSEHYWESIGGTYIYDMDNMQADIFAFGGIYDGCGFSISGFTSSTLADYGTNKESAWGNSFFGEIAGVGDNKAIIKNLNLTQIDYISGGFLQSAFSASTSNCIIENISLSGKIYLPYFVVEPYMFGAFSSIVTDNTYLKSCINYCDIACDYDADSVAGIACMALIISPDAELKIENCVNYGDITGAGDKAGILANADGAEGTVVINGCKNYGNIESNVEIKDGVYRTNGNAVGIVMESSSATIINCENYGVIIGRATVSGVVGTVSSSTIEGCVNYGDVLLSYKNQTDMLYSAGIVNSAINSIIRDCSNYGDVETNYINGCVSGLVGTLDSGQVSDSNNFGRISAIAASGIVVEAKNYPTISNCNNYGNLIGVDVNNKVGVALAGIVGLIDGEIIDCGSFGDMTIYGQGTISGICIKNTTSNKFSIKNCMIDFIASAQASFMVGGVAGYISNYQDKEFTVDKCAINIKIDSNSSANFLGAGVIDTQGQNNNPSAYSDDTNCYGVISSNGITIKHVSDLTTGMEGNFVYLDGFKDGMPVPVKTDGTNFFHMHDFGTKTGIEEQINNVLYPNLLLENVV